MLSRNITLGAIALRFWNRRQEVLTTGGQIFETRKGFVPVCGFNILGRRTAFGNLAFPRFRLLGDLFQGVLVFLAIGDLCRILQHVFFHAQALAREFRGLGCRRIRRQQFQARIVAIYLLARVSRTGSERISVRGFIDKKRVHFVGVRRVIIIGADEELGKLFFAPGPDAITVLHQQDFHASGVTAFGGLVGLLFQIVE
ncbi:MAG: hypothetical protein EBS53_17075 [Bacteroidetes bacterium]|nr:hypothetical protein [Bacteroidota bacterium]